MEGMKVLIDDVLDIIEKTSEDFYKKLQFGEIDEAEYTVALSVVSSLIFKLDVLAEETYETISDISTD